MSLILNIETATKNCSVSLSKDEQIIDILEYVSEKGYSHAEKLHVFIRDILKRNHLDFSDLSAVAVSKGPGSYTGLRIGVSTAKGLAFALNIPLISVSTLEHMAHQIQTNEEALIIPLLDARRMEVYSAVYNQSYDKIREIKSEIIDENSFQEYLKKKKVFFLGDATVKTKEVVLHKNAIFTDNKYPSAKEMSKISSQKFKNQIFENLAYFEPFYLKDFIATKKPNLLKK